MGFKKFISSLALVLVMLVFPLSPLAGVISGDVVIVNAESLEDDLGEDSVSEYDNGVADLFKNHRAMTTEQLENASRNLSPVTNIIGSAIGIVIVLLSSGIFLITALDLLYISIPPLRGFLYKGAQDEMQGGAMGGYGGRMGMGGYGGGYGGAQRGLKFQLISDEAVQCSMLIGGSQQSAGGGMPGGYGGMQAPQNEMSNKSIIAVYFKKRVFFMIFLAICTVMLTSSIFLGTGINLAQWLMSMVELLNNSIPTL